MKNKKAKTNIDKFNIREVICLLIIVSLVSLIAGFAITNRILKDKYTNKVINNGTVLDTFIENYNYIVDNYYGELDENKLLHHALEGVLEAIGDPHTIYIDEESVNNFDIKLDGSYQGIGIEAFVNKNDKLEIANIIKNSPAESSGLKVGDIIIKMDDEEINDILLLTKKIKEKESLKLTINRNDEILELTVTKGLITLTSVVSDIFEKDNHKIGYLGLSIFANNTYSQVKEKIEELELNGIDSLIIDLRDNTGGHLTSVENILGLFLNSNHIIYNTEDALGIKTVYSNGNRDFRHPIVILTNELSASASEILTATLKEELGARSVGQKTYGKGSAQELKTLPDGTKYKVTTKKWLTPSKKSIDKVGVDVDLNVELNPAYYINPAIDNDNQLQAAINMVLEKPEE